MELWGELARVERNQARQRTGVADGVEEHVGVTEQDAKGTGLGWADGGQDGGEAQRVGVAALGQHGEELGAERPRGGDCIQRCNEGRSREATALAGIP